MATETQALVKTPVTIKDILLSDWFKSQVAAALPRHMSAERMIRVARTATMRNPALLECTQESLVKCLLDCSAFGLEPDGRHAHLIPFKRECTLILDYKGIVALVRRSGDVSYIHADVVYENDKFAYSFGSDAGLLHEPALDNRGGKIKAFYSFVRLRDGSEDFVVLSLAEVDAIRKRSKAGNNGPWVTDFAEMGKKTAFRRHSKWLPLSAEVRDAIERDDDKIVDGATVERATLSLSAVTPSADKNRGHDATQPPETKQPRGADLPEEVGV